MKNLNSNLNPSMKDCAANAAATTVALNSFGTPVVPTKVAEFMHFIKCYLHDHMLLWDSTPFYEGIYTYPNGVQEYKVQLMHNGGYYSYVNEAVQAYNAKYEVRAHTGDAHHLYLPI